MKNSMKRVKEIIEKHREELREKYG